MFFFCMERGRGAHTLKLSNNTAHWQRAEDKWSQELFPYSFNRKGEFNAPLCEKTLWLRVKWHMASLIFVYLEFVCIRVWAYARMLNSSHRGYLDGNSSSPFTLCHWSVWIPPQRLWSEEKTSTFNYDMLNLLYVMLSLRLCTFTFPDSPPAE